jgi:hypothetical protein
MITIIYDPDCEMMRIEKDGEFIFGGNYWDFNHYPHDLKQFIEKLGIECKLIKEKYEE